MSGIVGIYDLEKRPVEREAVTRMVDILAHRGPDGADTWCEGNVGLGHRMLWTTPESLLEKQPLVDSNSDLVLTADARIDNRDELIGSLQINHLSTDKITDSDLILAAYRKWGEDCPKNLLGDFVFAIWDKRKQILFCARDHFGVKPFYYYYQAGQIFVFGSEIKGVLCNSEVPRHLNEVRVADYLANLFDDKAITFYKGIFRLLPAHTITVSQEKVQIRPYWSLDPSRELNLSSDQEYAEAFREIFTEAVRCRLRSAFPIGSTLSGGLDSSSITCVARQILAEEKKLPLHTFSYIYDDLSQCDEREFIESVVQQGDLIPHYMHGDQIGPFLDWKRVFWHTDETFLGPNTYLPWNYFHTAHQQGIRVLLDGFDGDTTVSHGIAYLTELMRKGNWSDFKVNANGICQNFGCTLLDLFEEHVFPYLEELAKKGQWITFVKEVKQIEKHFTISGRNVYLRHGLKPLAPQLIRQIWGRLHGQKQPVENINPIINPLFAKQINLKERIQSLDGSWTNPPLTAREDHWRRLISGLIPLPLEVEHRMAPAFAIEPRHPFMDKRLVEFCLAMPPEQKLHQGWTRMIVRRALEGILPSEVQWRGGKANLESNLINGLKTIDRAILDDVMHNDLQNVEKYVDVTNIRNLYQQFISSENIDASRTIAVLKPVALALWLRHTGLETL